MRHVVCSFEEAYREPCDVRGLLEFFALRALPGVEVVDLEKLVYRRTIDLVAPASGGGGPVRRPAVLRVGFDGACRASVLVSAARIEAVGAEVERAVASGVRRLFDLDANPRQVAAGLSGAFGGMRGTGEHASVRVPGAWDRFETAVRAVLGQQISVAGARTLAGRLAAALGSELPASLRTPGLERTFPTPDRFASFDLRTIGLPASRARALGELASQVASGELRFDGDPQDVRQRLLAVKGIGPWTAEYVAMRALGDRDAFPAGDLGLRKAIDRSEPPSAVALEAMAESWRPVRAYAAILLWRRAGGG